MWKQQEREDIKCEIYHMQHGEGCMNDEKIAKMVYRTRSTPCYKTNVM